MKAILILSLYDSSAYSKRAMVILEKASQNSYAHLVTASDFDDSKEEIMKENNEVYSCAMACEYLLHDCNVFYFVEYRGKTYAFSSALTCYFFTLFRGDISVDRLLEMSAIEEIASIYDYVK